MSRTIKDARPTKEKRRRRQRKPSLTRRYRNVKERGFTNASEEDYCPACGGVTSYSNGYLTCDECNWSTFETLELNFDESNYLTAA